MLYYYNKKEVSLKKCYSLYCYLFILIVFSFFLGLLTGYLKKENYILNNLSNEQRLIILNNDKEFNISKFENLIKILNFKFPEIILAQSIIETDSFRSNIFRENHNLFGMKVATKRVTINKGENRGHAYYDDWRESVFDYAFYNSTYLHSINTEDDYFNYLKNYAEDSLYVKKVKYYTTLIKKKWNNN